MSTIQDFCDLFEGHDYTRAEVRTKRNKDGEVVVNAEDKVEKKVFTLTGTPGDPQAMNVDHVKKHLDGTGNEVAPYILRSDDTLRFAVLDVDDYTVKPEDVDRRIQRLGLPVIPVRSRSGGTHLILFCSTWTDPRLARDVLDGWIRKLGLPGGGKTELLPKQTSTMGGEKPGTNYCLPYAGALSDRGTDRVAIWNGEEISLEGFIELAHDQAVSVDYLREQLRSCEEIDDGGWMPEGPPCMQTINVDGGVEDGSKRLLFNAALYFRKVYGKDDIEEPLRRYNAIITKCEDSEVKNAAKSAAKSQNGSGSMKYDYQCKEDPLQSRCDWKLCRKRKYGVGKPEGGSEQRQVAGIESLTKYKKPSGELVVWVANVDGVSLEVTTDELFSPSQFMKKCAEMIGKVPSRVQQNVWDDLISPLIASADTVVLPDIATDEGVIKEAIEDYLLGRVQAKKLSEVKVGKPYRDGQKITCKTFGIQDFLSNRRVKGDTSPKALWDILTRDFGATSERIDIDGKPTKIIVLPDPDPAGLDVSNEGMIDDPDDDLPDFGPRTEAGDEETVVF